MASLFVTELEEVSMILASRPIAMARVPPITTQVIAIGGSSEPSAAFHARTKIIRLHTDTACFLAFGSAPVAVTAAGIKLAANQTEYFAVTSGDKVAVIA